MFVYLEIMTIGAESTGATGCLLGSSCVFRRDGDLNIHLINRSRMYVKIYRRYYLI